MNNYIDKQLKSRDKKLHYDFLPPMIEIIDKPANKIVSIILFTCLALILTTIIWACASKIDIAVTATGSINSEDPVNQMTFLVDGTIETVNFKEGEYLKEGDVLCTLVSDASEAAVEQYSYSLEVLNIQKEMYEELYEKYKNDDFTSLETDTSVYGDKSGIADEIVLDNDIFIRNLDGASEEYQTELKNDRKLTVLKELNDLSENIKSVSTQLESAKQSLQYTRIVANKSGYLTLTSELYPGKTVTAGETVGYISDSDNTYYFVAYVPDESVEELQTGDKVKLKISAYNDTEYETVNGVITNISDVPISNEKLGVVYRTDIELSDMPDGLKTGMEGSVDIVIGTRSVMDYFLDPFKKGLKDSLKEK